MWLGNYVNVKVWPFCFFLFHGEVFFLLTRPLMVPPIYKLPDLDNIVNSINYVTLPISLIHNSSFDTDILLIHNSSFDTDILLIYGRPRTRMMWSASWKIYLEEQTPHLRFIKDLNLFYPTVQILWNRGSIWWTPMAIRWVIGPSGQNIGTTVV